MFRVLTNSSKKNHSGGKKKKKEAKGLDRWLSGQERLPGLPLNMHSQIFFFFSLFL